VYGVESFIAPRQALLSGGTLVDFREWELHGHTEVFGDIAQYFGSYAKAGVQDGDAVHRERDEDAAVRPDLRRVADQCRGLGR
jgi:hypothetical protein